jgi:group I intron endonuclease
MANSNELKKYHFIYKTTSLIDGRYYIGMHSTNNLTDGYLGSGTQLMRAVRKYGKENFVMEILEYLPTKELLSQREKEIVTMQEVTDRKCMNLKIGGIGGFPPTAKQRFLERMKEVDFKKMFGQKASERNKEQYKNGKRVPNPPNWTGRKHKPETLEKMKDVKKGWGKGETNSQFGTFWITDGKVNKKTKSEIPEGWYRGRV